MICWNSLEGKIWGPRFLSLQVWFKTEYHCENRCCDFPNFLLFKSRTPSTYFSWKVDYSELSFYLITIIFLNTLLLQPVKVDIYILGNIIFVTHIKAYLRFTAKDLIDKYVQRRSQCSNLGGIICKLIKYSAWASH